MQYIKDIFLPILRTDNESGLNLQRYRVQSLVCKEWRMLAMESITIINLNKLQDISKYRHFSLLAQIIDDDILVQFPNLNELIIYLPDVEHYWNDLYNKIENGKYDAYNSLTKDIINDYVKEGIDKTIASTVEIRNTTGIMSGIGKIVGSISNLLWYGAVDRLSNVLEYNNAKSTKAYIENKIIEMLVKIKHLRTINITAGNITIDKLLSNIPNLKHLSLTGYYVKPLDIEITKEHKLETFRLLRPFQHKDRDILKKLPNLKNLTIIIENNEWQALLDVITNIMNLKYLEHLEISAMVLPLASMANKLKNLKHIGFINCLVKNENLDTLAKMENIKKIDFLENINNHLYTDWTDSFRTYKHYKRVMIANGNHTEQQMDDFMLLRPNIKINYKNDILDDSDNTEFDHFKKSLYYSVD